MLSLTPRKGVGSRCRTGARALVVFLALAATLAAADLSPRRSPARDGAPAAPAAASPPAAAAADPDAALQRLAAETDRIKPSAPDSVAQLKHIVRTLIEVELSGRREIAALRSGSSDRSAAAVSRRRTRKKAARTVTMPAPAAGVSPPDGSPPATAVASSAFFAKRGLTKFHRAGCVFGERIHAEDRVYFQSAKEATAAGYEACKICKPGG